MRRTNLWRRSFNWRIVLLRVVVNGLALLITALLVPDIYFLTRTVGAVLLMAMVLGLLNAILKPVVQFLTSPFLFASYGLLVVVINALILSVASWLFPGILAVHGLFWALIGGMVIGLVSSLLENLAGATLPIGMADQLAETHKRARASAKGQVSPPIDLPARGGEILNPETSSTTETAEASDETLHA